MSDDTEVVPPSTGERYAPLSDCSVRTEAGERYIDALAAVFDTPQEIRDRDGHYMEVLDPASFDRTLAQRGLNFQVMFNHGKTMYGTPSERYTMPYGVPEVIRADSHGLVTTTRMLSTDLADEVYAGASGGALRGQSFSGKFVNTRKEKGQRGGLPTYRRTEVAMTEYGLTPFPYYQDAKVINVRADIEALVEMTQEDAVLYVASLSDVARAALVQALALPAPRTGEPDPPDPRTVIEVDSNTFTGASRRMAELAAITDLTRRVA